MKTSYSKIRNNNVSAQDFLQEMGKSSNCLLIMFKAWKLQIKHEFLCLLSVELHLGFETWYQTVSWLDKTTSQIYKRFHKKESQTVSRMMIRVTVFQKQWETCSSNPGNRNAQSSPIYLKTQEIWNLLLES